MSEERKPREKKRLSFAIYVAGVFVLTAAMTVLITAASIVIVWNLGFGSFSTDEELYIALLLAGFVALVLSVVLGLFFAASIARPIQRISNAAEAIKEGDLSARTNLETDDELGQLGQRFDEMADAIERDRDLERQLIGDVAHELRTPLMAIQATVEAIQDGVFEADEEHLNTISFETRRLGRLVDALLHLNRLENGTADVKAELINLSTVVNGLATTHEALIESAGIMFFTDIAQDVMIVGDQDLISQAIANLLSNAVRYTPDNGMITLELVRKDGYAQVSVTDTGVGIAEDDLKKVFSRFWRADGARQSVGGGLGIGLALVQEVVDQHRGDVSVESKLGEGSTFTMRLPLASEDMSKLPSTQRKSSTQRRREKAARKEQDKLRKIQERQDREKRRADSAAARSAGMSTQELKLFGLRVSLPNTKKEDKHE